MIAKAMEKVGKEGVITVAVSIGCQDKLMDGRNCQNCSRCQEIQNLKFFMDLTR